MSKYFATYLVLTCLAVSIAYADRASNHEVTAPSKSTRQIDTSNENADVAQEVSQQDAEELMGFWDEVEKARGIEKSKVGEGKITKELSGLRGQE